MTNDKLKMTNEGFASRYYNNVPKVSPRGSTRGAHKHLTFVIGHLTLLLVLSMWLSVANAQTSDVVLTTTGDTSTGKLTSRIGDLSLGYIKAGTREVANLTWHPDFKIGPWGMGADVNVALGEDKPDGYEEVVLRYLEYDDGRRGLRYGIIDNLTWGHGLLIKNYSTRIAGPVLLNSQQLALKGYLDMDKYVIRGLWTKSGINGYRVEERINTMLTLGQTYITDTNGVALPGTTESQKVTGVGLDASIPLPYNFEGYAEWAHLVDHGSGLGAGLGWGADLFVLEASFLAEYRMLDSNFVPGYFNEDYETNPINLTSAEATGNVKNGYLAQLGLKALDIATLTVAYENYNDSESASLNADLFARLPQDLEVTGYYRQPNFVNFRSLSLEQGAIMGGSIGYPINPYTKMVVHYKKVYNPDLGEVEESQYYELRMSF